jgi:hypothetical protein
MYLYQNVIMKKAITILLPICVSTLIHAQTFTTANKYAEIRLGTGLLTAPDIVETVATAFTAALVPVGYDKVSVKGNPAIIASVLFNNGSRLSYGADAIYQKTISTFTYSNNSTLTVNASWFSLMPRADLLYLDTDAFKIYGSVAAGAAIRHAETTGSGSSKDSKNGITFAFQATPIGIRAGNAVAVWAEAGIGFRGLLAGGISIKF